jgi:hypothetical protein
MRTDELIQALAHDVKPVSRRAIEQRIAIGMAAGAVISLMLIAALLGFRPDLDLAMRGFPFWMKWTYTISLGIGAIFVTASLARPGASNPRWLWLLSVPIVLLAGIGVAEIAHTPGDRLLALWLGGSWDKCPWLVLLFSLPIFVGLLWSFRRFAPTRLRAAGAAAGLAAGTWAAALYCLHCPEASAIFVLTWYSLGIALATGLGALLGPRVLRW